MKQLKDYRLKYDKILTLLLIKSYIEQSKICLIIPALNMSNFCGERITNNPQIEYKFNCGVYEGKIKTMPPRNINSEEMKEWRYH